MSDEHVYEEHVHKFGGRLKELMAEDATESEPAPVSEASSEKVAEEETEVRDPFARETVQEQMEREVSSRLGTKTAAQEIGIEILRQNINDLDDAPGVDLEQFITSARNG